MKDSQLVEQGTDFLDKYIKANNERFSTVPAAAPAPV